MLDNGADIGIALDGDADRLIVVDELGRKIDGDQLMATMALFMQSRGRLSHNKVVATVMSNLGLERFLKSQGIELARTAVGDRYVVEAMRKDDLALGGEQSGHLIIHDFATTGDGLLAALQILAVLKQSGKPASEALYHFEPVPQILENVRFQSGGMSAAAILDQAQVKEALDQANSTLASGAAFWCGHRAPSLLFASWPKEMINPASRKLSAIFAVSLRARRNLRELPKRSIDFSPAPAYCIRVYHREIIISDYE